MKAHRRELFSYQESSHVRIHRSATAGDKGEEMDGHRIAFDTERETLLIPLYGKAVESRKRRPILYDAKALEIIQSFDYDFSALKIPQKTNTMMCLRAKLIDTAARAFVRDHPHSRVLHLGCGLDSRYVRIDDTNVDWYDLDHPEVISIRREFFPETDTYHLIGSSVTEPAWLQQVPSDGRPSLVVAEGLFMYLDEQQIKTLLQDIRERTGPYTLIFDAFNVFTSRMVRNHPSLKKTGASIRWGIDDPEELTRWFSGIQFTEEIFFTSNEVIDDLGCGTRITYRIAHIVPMARKAHRILVYEIGDA
ncbi:MAG: class I SAM-dependent methyltransferase [Spirochaetia bacterium]|nr:class I SAM-dependent methyltransferase [Spirochaetia bacterium]